MKTLPRSLWIATLALAILSPPASAVVAAGTAPPVALVQADPDGVAWLPRVEYERLVLTVSQPDGSVMRQEVASGATLRFDLYDAEGQPRPDGLYVWELRVASPRPGGPEGEAGPTADRETGGGASQEVERLRRRRVQSGTFALVGGAVYLPAELQQAAGEAEEASPSRSDVLPGIAERDQVVGDELIVRGRACVGFDCAGGEAFGDDVLRLKENNLVLRLEDTSTGAGFPTNDWQLRSNEAASGGAERFSIEDADGGTVPFTLEAGAPTDALRVDAQGRVGLGTATPAADLHLVRGDAPALRLEQDGTLGQPLQSWELAGDEAGFLIRDLTGGSQVPLRIQPGADSDSLFVASTNDVGIGTGAPVSSLHVRRTSGTDAVLRVEDTDSDARLELDSSGAGALLRTMIDMQNAGGIRWQINDRYQVRFNNNQFQFDNTSHAGNECVITAPGDLNCLGTKNFVMVDPEDERRTIYYAALEGPEAGTYYRGTARTVAGEAVIELPEHFAKVTEAQGMTVQITPLGGWSKLYVAAKSPERLVVRVAEGEDLEFDFLVQGIRKGYLDYQVERSR